MANVNSNQGGGAGEAGGYQNFQIYHSIDHIHNTNDKNTNNSQLSLQIKNKQK